MAVKSNKSAGLPQTPKGPVQGQVLIDPRTGCPIDTVVRDDGRDALVVDATFSGNIGSVDVDLDPMNDGVHIGDPDTGFTLEIAADGSINVNVTLDSTDDSVSIGDSAGNQANVTTNNELQVRDADSITAINAVNTTLNSGVTVAATDLDIRNLDHTIDDVAIAANGNTAGVTSQGDLQTLALNELIPARFDDVEILAKNAVGDPTTVVYREGASTIATLTLQYDVDGDLQRVTRM